MFSVTLSYSTALMLLYSKILVAVIVVSNFKNSYFWSVSPTNLKMETIILANIISYMKEIEFVLLLK